MVTGWLRTTELIKMRRGYVGVAQGDGASSQVGKARGEADLETISSEDVDLMCLQGLKEDLTNRYVELFTGGSEE